MQVTFKMAKDSKDTETHDFSKFTVAELKEELSARDLSLTGNKKDLIERLNEYEQTHNGSGNIILNLFNYALFRIYNGKRI